MEEVKFICSNGSDSRDANAHHVDREVLNNTNFSGVMVKRFPSSILGWDTL